MKRFFIFGLMSALPLAAQDSSAAAALQADRLKAAERDLVLQATFAATVKNAPYSADAITTTSQTLGDGNRIEQTTTQKLYRDSEGRERREESVLAVGALAQTNMPHVITISDPVAGVSYSLNPEKRTAARTARGGVMLGTAIAASIQAGRDIGAGNTVAKEDLGSRTIEGVMAQGIRTTETIPPGAIGNVGPIRIVDETWYSLDLKMNVLTTHSDPRSGEVVYKLTNIQRGEQPHSLFEVPSDYIPATGARRGRGGTVQHPAEK